MKALAVLAVILLALQVAPVASATFNLGVYTGTGSDGAITRNANGNEAVNTIFATTFTIDAGVTRTLTVGTLVVYATTSIDIQGTLEGSGIGGGGGALGAAGTTGTANSGSGATTSTGATGGPRAAGSSGQTPANLWSMATASGSTNTAHGRGAGGGGGQTGTGSVATFGGGGGAGGPCAVGGNGGNAGTVVATGGTGGIGGAGGAGIVLIAPKITIGASAIIRANGANGLSATGSTPNDSSGGGGGSGGFIQIYARVLDEQAGSSVTANGGNGGNGGGSGGAGAGGGSGGSTGCNSGSNGGAPTNGGGGGGGGAGGIVVRHVDADNAFQGAYNSGTTYSYGDVVTYNGISYVAIRVTVNDQPDTSTSDWTVMGNSGFNSITVSASEPAGANCADAGRKITSGLDNGDGGGTARDGTLQSGEVDSTSYVCNGADGATGATGAAGANGFDGLTSSTAEPAGVNCADAGTRLDVGLDDGTPTGTPRNGLLEAGEIDETYYACNGPTGLTGPSGPIGITWQGAWDDSTSYADLDAVNFAGSAWICINAPCDDAPSPGDGEWDFIANSDGNVIMPSSLDISSTTGDFWLPVFLWFAAVLLFLKLGKLLAAGASTAGLGLALATNGNLGWAALALIILVLALWLEATLMEGIYQRWFSGRAGRREAS